jgi:hypothetical protein
MKVSKGSKTEETRENLQSRAAFIANLAKICQNTHRIAMEVKTYALIKALLRGAQLHSEAGKQSAAGSNRMLTVHQSCGIDFNNNDTIQLVVLQPKDSTLLM